MRFAMYSDLHVRPSRLNDCATVLKAIPEIAKRYQCDFVYNGGDTFDTRGIIETSCLNLLYEAYSDWYNAGIRQIINVGNHDQEDRDGKIHPMKVFESFDSWYVVDEPRKLPDVPNAFFVPYLKPDVIEVFFKETKCKPKTDIFVHWGIRGAKRNDHNVDKDGVPVEWLKSFRRVISGHYHYRSSFENVQYIGSPMQQDFSEMGQDKGVLIYDSELQTMEFVPIEGTQKHHRIEVSLEGKKRKVEGDLKAIDKDDFVEMVVSGDASRVAGFTKELAGEIVSAAKIKLSRNVKENVFSRINIESHEIYNNEALMNKYVDYMQTGLDKKKLLEIGLEIING